MIIALLSAGLLVTAWESGSDDIADPATDTPEEDPTPTEEDPTPEDTVEAAAPTPDESEVPVALPDDDAATPEVLLVSSGDMLVGTSGNDTIALEAEIDGPLVVDAAAGNDEIDLTEVFDTTDGVPQVLAAGSTINGGAGNDVIQAHGDGTVLQSGDGRDDIAGNFSDSTIDGGFGNDSLTITGAGNLLSGGDGADAIIIDGTDNTVHGGSGNDTITATGGGVITGGGGFDFIEILMQPDDIAGLDLTGGTGIDVFELHFDDLPGDATAPALDDPDAILPRDIGVIQDFDGGNDLLVIQLPSDSAGYSFGELTLREVTDPDSGITGTEATLSYIHENGAARALTVHMAGVSNLPASSIQLVDPVILPAPNLPPVPPIA
ncbi:calcium-binding protein [Sagittula sp. SSi028]|uniref:calcium-binding protein n=1 Tax=Sagittula sp. SSi028 TaxID=3400636 RepID=UPI003AF63F9B